MEPSSDDNALNGANLRVEGLERCSGSGEDGNAIFRTGVEPIRTDFKVNREHGEVSPLGPTPVAVGASGTCKPKPSRDEGSQGRAQGYSVPSAIHTACTSLSLAASSSGHGNRTGKGTNLQFRLQAHPGPDSSTFRAQLPRTRGASGLGGTRNISTQLKLNH